MNGTLLTLGILVGLVLVAFVGLHLYVYSGLWFAGITLRRRLAASGRTLSLSEAKSLITVGNGSMVVDAPTLGWNVCRVWWSPNRLIPNRPERLAKERMCSEEDQQNYDKLIDPTRGTAKIVCPFVFSTRLRPFLQKHFGSDECLFVFTAGVEFERELQKRREDEGARGKP